MKKAILIALLFIGTLSAKGQNYYFPPTTGSTWGTVSPISLNWCTDKLDTVFKLLDDRGSKGFIVLKGGKIAVEKYFGTFTKDSVWYWASAGKTITGFLIGIAQQEDKLKITDTASKYLGKGWTQCTPVQEDKITIWHQLTMTSGLDDGITPTIQEPDPDNCLKPECLLYKADAGTRWAYHNAPYRILQDLIDSATGQNINQYTNQKLRDVIGMNGLWFDYVYYSMVRDMARFGSLIINKGKWGSTTVMSDTNYLNAAVNTSQSINPSYGYLWWLNGKAKYKVPGLQFDFSGPLIPNAPADMYAGLGKNDQKLYIIPSMDMVIVRMGNSSGQPVATVSSFDNELWGLLKEVFCANGPNVSVNIPTPTGINIYPNPASNTLYIEGVSSGKIEVYDIAGKMMLAQNTFTPTLDVVSLESGVYVIRVFDKNQTSSARFIKE